MILVQLTGDPGSGKSFSVKTLNPKETFVIDADGKGLAYAG
jgi:dephospho-CoA kinase